MSIEIISGEVSVADEPTIGELARVIDGLRRSVEQLASKVLTVEVWKAERELMELRIHENEKDIASLEAKTVAEREKREREKADADNRAKSLRTQFLFAIVTAVIAPIIVGIVLAAILN